MVTYIKLMQIWSTSCI